MESVLSFDKLLTMAAILKIIFWLCLSWLAVMAVLSLIIMAVVNVDTGRAWIDKYLLNGFSLFAFVFVIIRIAGGYFVKQE